MKKPLSFILSVILLISAVQVVSADQVLHDIEPNDTIETATQIERNNIWSPDEYKDRKRYNSSFEENGDIDFYKLYLPAGETTLIVIPYNGDINFSLYNADGDEFYNEIFTKQNMQNEIIIPEEHAGLCYARLEVEIQNDTSELVSYALMIGNPFYKRDSIKVYFPASTLTTRRTTSPISHYDLANEDSIPDDAIVYEIAYGGQKVGSAYDMVRSVKSENEGKWFHSEPYIWRNDNISTWYSQVHLKQRWSYKHSATSLSTNTFTFYPWVRFEYFYKQDMDNSSY